MTEKALELLGQKNFSQLKTMLGEMNPVDIAGILEEMPQENLLLIYRLLPKELAAEAFAEMDNNLQEILIQAFSDQELQEVLDELYLDDTVDMIEEMPANVVKRILQQTKPAVRKKINEILHYPEDSAGSIMTIEYVDLKKIHDGGRSIFPYPQDRSGQRDNLYLLCNQFRQKAGRTCHSKGFTACTQVLGHRRYYADPCDRRLDS